MYKGIIIGVVPDALNGGVSMDNIWTSLLGLCAGMALFLYSIKMTSGSLEVIAGNKMKSTHPVFDRYDSNGYRLR